MSELSGTVTARSQYGIKVDGDDDWYNWSKDDFRGEPWEADLAVKGKRVVCEVDGKYIQTIKVLDDGPLPPSESGMFSPAQVSGKDILMAKMNAIKTAGELYAACIAAGTVKALPTPETIKAYAEAIEAKLD